MDHASNNVSTKDWIGNLDPQTVILVPTRTLASSLNEQIARYYINQQRSVWEAPNIVNWSDYLVQLWSLNRAKLSAISGAHNLINQQQASVVWTQVIDASKRDELALTLLNVQQTARATQRSWRLMTDWRLSPNKIADDHVADTERYLAWLDDYQDVLKERQLIDQASLINLLLSNKNDVIYPFEKQIWHCFDLLSDAQKELIENAQSKGVKSIISHVSEVQEASYHFYRYANTANELNLTLDKARALIEADPEHTINIVIPNLEQCQAEVHEAIRMAFYANESPLDVQNNASVVRLSLGQALSEWPAVSTALSIIRLLRNRLSISDLNLLLRSQFVSLGQSHQQECSYFMSWLAKQRLRTTSVDVLADLYLQCREAAKTNNHSLPDHLHARLVDIQQQRQALQTELDKAKEQQGYASISIVNWPAIFEQWLSVWGWHEGANESSLSSVQFQLINRWQRLLEDFTRMATVQRSAGLQRAIELLTLMARESIFLPQSVDSPIVISGVYEAIGRPADTCFLLGQDQSYPAPANADAFIPNRLLLDTGYPYTRADKSFQQAQQVQNSLLRGIANCVISYARIRQQDRDLQQSVSPFYREQDFEDVEVSSSLEQSVDFQQYRDTQGPAWQDPSAARGGSAIFTNQSNCAFKAFATHQLGFLRQDEAEFGLDSLDRGNIVHRLLQRAWGSLGLQTSLNNFSEPQLNEFCQQLVDQLVEDPELELNNDKRVLLRAEKPRLIQLLNDWLTLETKRPQGFSVVDLEVEGRGNIGGIDFKYIIDRIDVSDDGRSVVVDYKTGQVNRNDWLGERLRAPQLPLYALALDAAKRQPVSGIAYASVRQYEHSFIELSEAAIFRKESKITQGYQEKWIESRADWPSLFDALAKDFIAGAARVNPIDETSCNYCELKAMCRISQLNETPVTQEDLHD